MPDISLFLNFCFVLPIPVCPSTTGVLLQLNIRTIIMEVGIQGLLTRSMVIEYSKFNQVFKKFKHCVGT